MTERIEPYSSFVPRGLHDYLLQLARREHADEVPFGTVREGAVLFADASGFTRLTEQLAQEVCVVNESLFGSLF
jgi:class 3 adenylate cyclase